MIREYSLGQVLSAILDLKVEKVLSINDVFIHEGILHLLLKNNPILKIIIIIMTTILNLYIINRKLAMLFSINFM